MNKKGFISTLFLGYLFVAKTIILVIENQLQSRIQVYLNMKEAYTYLPIEVALIDWLKCEIKNDRLQDGNYSIDAIEFEVIHSEGKIKILLQQDKLTYLEYPQNLFKSEKDR